MSLSASSLPDIPGLGPLAGLASPGRQTPIYTQLPKVQTALQRKYANPSLQSALGGLPPHIRTAFVNYDLARAARGSMPLTGQQTLGALKSAVSQQAATPKPEEGIWGRTLGDLRSLVDVPHIVSGLVSEAQQLPQAPAKLAEVLGRGDLRDIVGGLSEVPGLRLVPGVYTASNLAQGGPAALLEHPLYTALDVLPYAKAPITAGVNLAAGRLPRVAAEAARLATPEVAAATEAENAARTAAGLKPLPEPSNVRLAAQTSPTLQLLGDLPLFQNLSGKVLGKARDVNQFFSSPNAQLRLETSPLTPVDHPALLQPLDVPRNVLRNMQEYRTQIPPERLAELGSRFQLEHVPDLIADPALTDVERAFVQTLDTDATRLANFGIKQDWLPPRIDGDVYTAAQYKRIMGARNATRLLEGVNQIRNRVANVEPGVLPALDHLSILDEHVTRNTARTMGQGYAQLVDKAGFDGDVIRQAAAARDATKESIASAIQQTAANPVEKPLMPLDELVAKITPHVQAEARVGATGERGTAYSTVADNIRSGDFNRAARKWKSTVAARRLNIHPDAAAITDTLERYRDMENFNKRTAGYSDRAVEGARRVQARVERRTLPANYVPLMEKLLYDPTTKTGEIYNLFQGDDAALANLNAGFPEAVQGLRDNPAELRAVEREVRNTVATMRENGLKPGYIHRVSPDKVGEVLYPHLTDWLKTPSSVRERTLDVKPYHPDPTVAVSHQAVEFLNRYIQESTLEQFVNVFGKDEATALAEVRPLAERIAKGDPLKARAEADRLINHNYEPYNSETFFPGAPARLRITPNDRVYLPKAVDIALKDLFRDHEYRFAKTLDPVMNIFRTSVLAYAPRFHVNNVAGGAMLMGLEEPGALPYMVSHWKEISEFNKSGERAAIPGSPPAGMGFYPNEIKEWLGTTSLKDRVAAVHDYQAAVTARRLLGEAQGVAGTVVDKLKAGANKSYELNQKVDDFYRSTAYKYGFDKALKKGMTAEQAQAAGVALERKILPEWDRMTPFERNVIRSFFPFYSFSKFILNYALHFPFDHPYRVSVMSSIARNEMQDFGDWLPSDFAKMFFVGSPDKNGVVRAITPGAMNPFQDVASMFTMGGIMGRMNPLITAAFKSVGIDPSKGNQELYPDVSYDPQTGRLKPSNPNLLTTALGSIIPQTQLITALIGHNNNFAQMLQSNPEAAATMLRSGLGLPNLYRNVNVPQEAFKAEVGRQSVQSQIKNRALTSGDWSQAMKYPGLRPFFEKLNTVMQQQPEVLKAYQSQVASQNIGDALKMAVIEKTVPV